MRPTRQKTPRRRRAKRPNKLMKLREGLGLTLLDVFKATGAVRAAISRWENGQGEPQLKFREKYAQVLGITKAELGAIIYGD